MNAKHLIDNFHQNRKPENYLPFLLEKPILIKEIVQILLQQTKYPYSEYGSWLLTHFAKKHPDLLIAHYDSLIDLMFISKNQSVLRNCANTIELLPYADYREAEFLDLLMAMLMDKSNKLALLVHSLYLLIPICKKYPELKNEINSIISLYKETESPALKAAFRKFNKLT